MTERHGKGGQSARLMASKRHLRVLFYAGVMIVLLTLWLTNLSRIIHLGPAAIGLAVAFVGIIELLNSKGKVTKKPAKHAERGAKAEEMVGEQLGELPERYCVFNDVSCGNFNIDHIVVGPKGVFAVETKGRAKPDRKGGTKEAKVVCDGQTLRFPDWSESHPLKQARSQASWLAKWLDSAVGEPVPVQPVLALPPVAAARPDWQ
jgi:hypothetical protein